MHDSIQSKFHSSYSKEKVRQWCLLLLFANVRTMHWSAGYNNLKFQITAHLRDIFKKRREETKKRFRNRSNSILLGNKDGRSVTLNLPLRRFSYPSSKMLSVCTIVTRPIRWMQRMSHAPFHPSRQPQVERNVLLITARKVTMAGMIFLLPIFQRFEGFQWEEVSNLTSCSLQLYQYYVVAYCPRKSSRS